MIILAIETSCDDTCVVIVEAGKRGYRCGFAQIKILSNVIFSQVKVHQKYGGIHPSLAKREHQNNLAITLERALKKSKMLARLNFQFSSTNFQSNPKFKKLKTIFQKDEALFEKTTDFLTKYQKPKIDAIAVTVGPGLEPCLWTGVNFAKALAYFWNLPIIPVNHIESHIMANWLQPIRQCQMSPCHCLPMPSTLVSYGAGRRATGQANVKCQMFPAVCLVVSGGHTQLILMKDFGKYKILGETRDDAAGECFDKTARILGLNYPGGPSIAAKASMSNVKCSGLREAENSPKGCISNVKLPRPMLNSKNYDFSFSGLKTAVLYDYKKRPKKIRVSNNYIQQMCFEIQQSIIDVLIKKTISAAKEYKAKAIILGGGVIANENLRNQFMSNVKCSGLREAENSPKGCISNVKFLAPIKKFCTDNAAMIAITAYFLSLKGKTKNWKKIIADANLRLTENRY
jgi:N6-L-threonylcarbamoyladenine synthase